MNAKLKCMVWYCKDSCGKFCVFGDILQRSVMANVSFFVV